MSVVTIFNGVFCREEQVARELSAKTGYKLIFDRDVTAAASKASGMAEGKIERAFAAKASVFNKFTHEKELSVSYLRLGLGRLLRENNLVISGFSGQLIDPAIRHVLRVCLIGDMKYRTAAALEDQGLAEKEAQKMIHKQDEEKAAWVKLLYDKNDPWDASLYDMVVPMDKTSVTDAVNLIAGNAASPVVQYGAGTAKAVEDFLLAATVEAALAKEGHNVLVTAKKETVTLTINKHVLMLSRLEEDLKSIASKIPGVKTVKTKVGKDFYQADVYRQFDFELPSRVLLVDDEREFVQTLSERLMMRDMGSAVAYDGESALRMVQEDEPEVMILDLKMPGIDGIEVLRRVKETRPEIEVIILTGHGSEGDRQVCMDLGAFAYLQKPVDIDILSDAIKKANEKIKQNKGSRSR